ncbi:MAG: hypothetical protein QOG23_233 [Blastocatellia bacterium]|jgi:hypothetical protein|nr:hypothetical protein [Blastocatellia bacterium]
MSDNKALTKIPPSYGHQQKQITLFPVTEVEVDGIQMGVLSDGSPFLTLRGLARMCGVDHTALLRLATDWDNEKSRPRGLKIQELLAAQGHSGDSLYLRTRGKTGETHAYVDAVCMAILEYYAFDAVQANNDTALRNYRLLARSSFRAFIYNRCGYDPDKHIPDSWRNFHERILLNDQVPVGHFSVFREIADLVVNMIQKGLPIDEHTVPDISVGSLWSGYWAENDFDEVYGPRLKHPHYYPDWFPQSAINPVDAWIYPAEALGQFRIWIYRKYVPLKFPKYLAGKVKKGLFLPSRAELLLDAVSKPESAVEQLPPAKSEE